MQEVISLLNFGSIDVADDDIRVVAICGPARIDVDNVEKLNILGKNRAIIGRGSRIIVTTRDASIFGLVKLDATYEPQLLNENESFVLFCRPAVLKDMAARLSCLESVQYWEWALKDLMHNSSW
ncbi:resistance protein [Tanacetum coccineum]